ncbi:MAG: type I DNA topoisomerase [Heliobacteriaceae bacterium]|jgi:DNA topoisomerase-1|nr:type I DNA topoisomerase [Heliobacteriaceae bacterium]
MAKANTDKNKTKKASGSLKKTNAAPAREKALVIVESPAKSKTIKKILGDNFTIEASFGHIRDFPKNVLGFDVQKGFEPSFIVIPEKKKVVTKLNEMAKKADKIYLASDPDREGEAIAWHVREVLNVPDSKIFRIEFNEITPKAVKYAVENYRAIDMDKVKAQHTRQILDKLVGYKLSPILWKKLGNYRLSAGRVQSVALRMICEREEEIEAFIPQEYWSITAELDKDGSAFEAELSKYQDKKIEIPNEEEALKIVDYLRDKSTKYEVCKVTDKQTQRKPTAPFITSTLQREASSKLGYGVSKTMQIAQKLYEGIELESGSAGLITYMRTDSVRISDDARDMAKDFILANYGQKYYPEMPNNYVKGKKENVQDAHEAIRPSYPERTPESIKEYLSNEQYRLYKLIWTKFMSSQMTNAKVANKSVEISAGEYTLRVSTSKILFDGFLKLYNESEEEVENKIPDLEKGDSLSCRKVTPKQHFTQPPPRYSEAALVKALEEHGIGRPSTYASIITKIQTRGYVEKLEKALAPTLLGRTVSKQLVTQFTNIMDYKFTAGMETRLDNIAAKKAVWNKVLQNFYEPFMVTVNEAMKDDTRVTIESGVDCPNCGKPMVLRTSRKGSQFLGCSGFPECKTMMPLNAQAQQANEPEVCDIKCEKCGGDCIFKVGPYGKYIECTACQFRKPYRRSTGVTCPKCEKGDIVERKSKRGTVFYGCSKYPDCDFTLWNEPTGEVCPECGALLVKKALKKGTTIECSNKMKGCSYKKEVEENE